MNTFEFRGRTFKIVEDHPSKLIDGCNKCAFSSDAQACADVDDDEARKLGRQRCDHAYHHYEEVHEDV